MNAKVELNKTNILTLFLEFEARTPDIDDNNFHAHIHYCFFSRKDYEKRMVDMGCKFLLSL